MTDAELELDAAYINLSRALTVYRDAQTRFERAMTAVSDQAGLESALTASARRLAGSQGDDPEATGRGVA